MNREGWLTAFAEAIAPVITQRTGLKVPMDRIRLSCSFPRTRATPNRKGSYTTGVCMHGNTHKSGLHELFINPLVADVITPDGRGVGETVIHEMLHACLDPKVGHKAKFAKHAKEMGLEGKPTSTTAGPEAIKIIKGVVDKIGDYPHEALDGQWGKKQTTRLLKVQCVDCGYVNEAGNGYTARITMTWIENAGLPTCPCGAIMSLIMDDEDKALISLTPVESSATYKVPTDDGEGYDDRFQIRRVSSEHFGERWSVIDFGERTVQDMFSDSTPRIVAAESKLNALELIHAVREGLFTWDEHETDIVDDYEDEDDDGSNPLAEDDPDLDALLYIADDEDEESEYPEEAEAEATWNREHPITGKVFTHEFDYDLITEAREASGTAKSQQIASGAESAMD
jgi:hypothetical protein